VEFYGTPLMLLVAVLKCLDCGELRAIVFPASDILENRIEMFSLSASFIFASLVYLTYKTMNLYY
jgi:hypothetical protein